MTVTFRLLQVQPGRFKELWRRQKGRSGPRRTRMMGLHLSNQIGKIESLDCPTNTSVTGVPLRRRTI